MTSLHDFKWLGKVMEGFFFIWDISVLIFKTAAKRLHFSLFLVLKHSTCGAKSQEKQPIVRNQFYYQHISWYTGFFTETQRKGHTSGSVPAEDHGEDRRDASLSILGSLFCLFTSLLPAAAHLPFAMALFTVRERESGQQGRKTEECHQWKRRDYTER